MMFKSGGDRVQVYSRGIVCMSVCSELSAEETEAWIRKHQPTGISSEWTLSTDKEFASGEPHPAPCNIDPATRKHYLFNC